MIVSASTASTRRARKTVMKSADPLTIYLADITGRRRHGPTMEV